ncbi:unnamed protein product [Clonostachys rosea f. rosea IK726]|uniref:Uncharacterized protein n=1 Tax=Clonostachys rosea f. rosea IK726 TaxID=1349383 RepID=A0ACA9U8V6_BIOOC|nr:unnamed protein product [Clonostachys rosea f. rosea IK726]
MRARRFVCVGIPVLLTIGAIITYLIAALSGVVHNSVHLFMIDLSKLDIDKNNISNFISDNIDILGRDVEEIRDITASNLGFGDSYDVNLWGCCTNKEGSDRECTKAQFNWANTRIKKDFIGPIAGKSVELPKEMKSALDIFIKVTKWTQIAFVVILVSLGVELIIGVFSSCTRIISCLTTFIGIVAIVFSLAASGLATGMAVVIVGAVKSVPHSPSPQVFSSSSPSAAASLSIARSVAVMASGSIPSSGYYPIGSDNEMASGNGYHNQNQPAYNSTGFNNGRSHSYSNSDVAYEPFSHRT